MTRTLTILVALLATLVLPAVSAAQEASGTVNGTGSVILKRMPSAVRMQVQISGEGKTIKEALAKLKERRDAVQKKLADLGASEDAIKFDEPSVAGQDRQAQMEAMMRSRLRPGTAQAKPGAVMVRVVANAHGQWPISAKSTEDLLIAVAELREKVVAAKLSEDKTATLEEQEALEEAIGFDMDEMSGASPGEPVFSFVAKVSPQDRAKALADAFQKAKTDAGDMAKAAGAELGALKNLSGNSSGGGESDEEIYYARLRGGYRPMAASEDPDEAVSYTPGMVVLNVYVTASFNIK